MWGLARLFNTPSPEKRCNDMEMEAVLVILIGTAIIITGSLLFLRHYEKTHPKTNKMQDRKKEDKLEKIERVLKVYAQKNQDMAEALRHVGLL
ncbi:MAG: hypothetical protein AB1325_13490 [Nitrospirota bacterium]